MRIYIAGPMRGYPLFNFPAFDRAAAVLRQFGHEVVSPAEMDREVGLDETANTNENFDIKDALRRDFKVILDVDGIALLPGWENSTGANAERFVAETTGRDVFRIDPKVLDPSTPVEEWRGYPSLIWVPRQPDVQPRYNGMRVGVVLDEDHQEAAATGEVRIVDPTTGGAKGQKLAQLGAIDATALLRLAEVAGFGATKYARYNFLKGYAWSLSIDAAFRHLLAFAAGEDVDPESGLPHPAHFAWHGLALTAFREHGLGTDDRWQKP